VDLGQWIVIGLSALMAVWFFGASSYNRRREEDIFRWIYRGLKVFGQPEPLGQGSRARLSGLEVSKASDPFRSIKVMYRLERRENPPLWIFEHLQGRRDELEVRAVYKSAGKGQAVENSFDRIKDCLGPFRSALIENGGKREGKELLLRFNLSGLLEKDADNFFEALKAAAAAD
jgi:hypothetical protein